MAGAAQISSSLCSYSSIRDNRVFCAPINASATRFPPKAKFGTTFASGSPLLVQKASNRTNYVCYPKSVIIKCEQNTKDGNGIDVWVGRLAMVGFAAAISVEVGTGKGLLENFGLTSPLPTVALAVTALVGVLTAVFIFQSASDS